MVIYLAGLQNIPTEIIEAAKIERRERPFTAQEHHPSHADACLHHLLLLDTANALKTFDLIYALSKATSKALGTANLSWTSSTRPTSSKNWGLAARKGGGSSSAAHLRGDRRPDQAI
jgi:ABC-type sugar transport system permease subunit